MSPARGSGPEARRGKRKAACNCGWEVKLGYGVAVTLVVFEAKRLLAVILEMLTEWRVIRFVGGFSPVMFSLADAGLGLPTSLVTVRTIRVQSGAGNAVRALRILLAAVAICCAMNTATLVSIGHRVNASQDAVVDAFNGSMRRYGAVASVKYAVDEMQFDFQCCGHSSYRDWFLVDWQRVDYASREEMAMQERISDEAIRDRAVPFSCCDPRAPGPCVHAEILDVKTINKHGCARVISSVALRVVIAASVMTGTLLLTQILLAFLIAMIVRKAAFNDAGKNWDSVVACTGFDSAR